MGSPMMMRAKDNRRAIVPMRSSSLVVNPLPRAAGGFRDLLHHLIEAEARGLLSGREVLEAREPVRDVSLCGYEQIDALDPPHRIADRFMTRPLGRIGAHVGHRRQPQAGRWLRRHTEA